LDEITKNDPTEKILIFSQFTSLLDLLEVPISDKKMRYQRYDGSMKMSDRADAVDKFMDDKDEKIMLLSLKAGNAGLNLAKASQVILLDPFWNPFVEEQAVDRAHRMPQPREVTVHRVLVPETVEDRIIALQDKKRELIEAALDENTGRSLTRLNVQELRYLFGMGS
jgi:SNF2 family DNA or RNA helicase